MNRAITRISLALALGGSLIGAIVSPALADGDPYYSNGINPSGVRTPVPAPIPVPVEEADWYFRADFAAGFGCAPSVSTYRHAISSTALFGLSQAGRRQLRALVHRRRRRRLRLGSILPHRSDGRHPFDHVTEQSTARSRRRRHRCTVVDKTKFMSTILLANAYYDFRTGTPWTPYLGGGVGFAVNQLTRNARRYRCDGQPSRPTARRRRSSSPPPPWSASPTTSRSFFSIDFGYRFLYIGGSERRASQLDGCLRRSKSAASTSTRFAPAYGSYVN